MTNTIHDPATPDADTDDRLPGPRTRGASKELRLAVLAEGALDSKTKQLIAVAVAHVTRCPCCINGHTALATRAGATPQEITESVWVAVEVHAGGTFAHSTRAPHSGPARAAAGLARAGWRD